MLEYYDNDKKLSIVEAPSFSRDKFERELTGLTKTLRALFEQLGLKNGFSLRRTPKPRYLEQTLSYDVFRDMLSLSLEREERVIGGIKAKNEHSFFIKMWWGWPDLNRRPLPRNSA